MSAFNLDRSHEQTALEFPPTLYFSRRVLLSALSSIALTTTFFLFLIASFRVDAQEEREYDAVGDALTSKSLQALT